MVGNGGCFCRKICYNPVILFEGEPDLKLSRLIFPPDGASRGTLRAHRAYLAVLLTLLGVGIGFLGLWLTACADAALPQAELYRSYLDHPLLLALNLFPPLLLAWLGYFLSGRCWCGVLLSGLFGVGLPLINYYKVMLRGDPMRASDILLLRTAGGIMSQYEFERTAEVNTAVALLGAMLAFAVLLMPRGDKRRRARALGAAACVLLGVGAYLGAYADEAVYERTANDSLINIWSDNEVYLSRGFALSFLHSVPELFPEKPEGYDARAAQTLLESFPDEDIPEGEKVAVMGVMLEAFCDLTDFDALAGFDTVQEVYAPWHALEEQSLSGRLLTNIFAGGTVDTEWGFLTGASEHDEYRGATGSYVRYFTAQGYAAHYAHPGYSWFYDRERVNDYLGFERSVFTENGFGELVDPYVAMWHSDQQLADYLLADLDAADGSPLFSFAVSYQNHGPYAETESAVPYVSPEASGWSQESCNILNNYIFGVNETVREYVRLTQELDARDTPVVLVLFGDHKPWMGNGGSVYEEMGIDFDTSTLAGFRNYYATPYLIWANRAAKEVLGADFTGDGGDFSPCFLMTRLFDACGWDGPGYMQLSRAMRDISPLLDDEGFIGFENDGFVNSGQVIAAVSHHPVIQAMIEEYKKLHFTNADGTTNAVGCPHLNTDVMERFGLVPNGREQVVAGIHVYPADFFNPLDSATGKLVKTENTYSIHWYSMSWLPKRVRIKAKLGRMARRLMKVIIK